MASVLRLLSRQRLAGSGPETLVSMRPSQHREVRAAADLRRERALEVLVPAAAEDLQARHPHDGGQDGALQLVVVVDDELPQGRLVADGVRDGALQAVLSSRTPACSLPNTGWRGSAPSGRCC
jgi:hypothetical protein